MTIFLKRFISVWLPWVFVAASGLSLAAVSEGYSLVAVCGLPMAMVSLAAEHGLQALGLQWLQLTGSRTQAQELWHVGLVVPRYVILLDQ